MLPISLYRVLYAFFLNIDFILAYAARSRHLRTPQINIPLFVCMNSLRSTTIRARLFKFNNNISKNFLPMKCILEHSHALFCQCKTKKIAYLMQFYGSKANLFSISVFNYILCIIIIRFCLIPGNFLDLIPTTLTSFRSSFRWLFLKSNEFWFFGWVFFYIFRSFIIHRFLFLFFSEKKNYLNELLKNC